MSNRDQHSAPEQTLLERVLRSEARLQTLEEKLDHPVERVKRDLISKGVYSFTLKQVPSNYYDCSLSERAKLLGATIPQLCKSIIFENTAWVKDDIDSDENTNSRYYLVVVQYGAKFDAELLRDLVHSLRKPEERLSRKRFHFQLAPEAVSDQLSGYTHNAVVPFGLRVPIPIVICKKCLSVQPPFIYMGGGKVDVKLGLSVADFVRVTGAIVGDISVPRSKLDEDEKDID